MEQIYMIEIFVDKVNVFTDDNEVSTNDKNLIIKIKFGPTVQFIVKEGQLVVNNNQRKDVTETTPTGRKQWSRTIRVGKSYLFPSYPDTLLTLLSKFPLELEVWNDDENELPDKIYVGVGTMNWHTKFFHYLKETSDLNRLHKPITIKDVATLYQECCCSQAGEVVFILRMSALGGSIITEFQQMLRDPDKFCFRTDKAPGLFECRRVEGDDPNFCMIGSLYETATLEDPTALENAQTKIEVCTELQSCGIATSEQTTCEHPDENDVPKKKYAINKIKMGDITGPCGNTNCPLAHKVKMYIRNLDSYKTKAAGITGKKTEDGEGKSTKKICGSCGCKDDRWHREDCPEKDKEKTKCSGCEGMADVGETCEDNMNKHFGTGATPIVSPKGSKTPIRYVTEVPDFKTAIFRQDYTVEECCNICYSNQDDIICKKIQYNDDSIETNSVYTACHRTNSWDSKLRPVNKVSTRSLGNNPWVYNIEVPKPGSQRMSIYNVTVAADEKDCSCSPVKPSPPCKTFDCNCITEAVNHTSRKAHRPFCPLYKHKSTCPVTMMHEEEDKKQKGEEDEDEAEPLPYGLPPIQLGPCPVMGRPCSMPDGFARMYKNAALPAQPPSYSDAGKVCCSKEYEKIRRAVKEYMKYQKDHDMRCVNRFDVDTEKRCCDKEQILKSLMGRECCGLHKLAIQEKFKKDEKK